jgi:hypothetical protein
MSRVIFPGYASDDCGETVVPADVAEHTEHGQVIDIDYARRIVRIQLPVGADMPSAGHEARLKFFERID